MKTKEALEQRKFSMDNWLNEKKLGDILVSLFPKGTFIHDQIVPKSGILKRPDYRNDNYNLIVEFDGAQHYTDVRCYYVDKEKDDTYTQMGYRVVRIPYFVQLCPEVIKHLFDIDIDYAQTFPHGFIVDKGETLPADFCSLGYDRFLNDLKRFSYIKEDILASLRHKLNTYLGDWNRVLPNYASKLLKQEILDIDIA